VYGRIVYGRIRWGAILLISSAAGVRGCAGAIAYGVAKGAMPQFTRALARELADFNIRVNCVSPGIIRTRFQDYLTSEQVEDNTRNRIPLHREGRPKDVAAALAALTEMISLRRGTAARRCEWFGAEITCHFLAARRSGRPLKGFSILLKSTDMSECENS
jgi:NAD(P)-dependent dehydrogenase (short-subunit alcohol dehydrogenase family)